MKLKELKKWPKIWEIAEKQSKIQQGENYSEDEYLSDAFTWINTGYTDLFVYLNSNNIAKAKKEFPEMFTTENKIYELWN
jgi:hypothetical protein